MTSNSSSHNEADRPSALVMLARTNAWIHDFRRLRIRWEIRDDIHEAFLKPACRAIAFRRVRALGQLS
ncbi:hypothetical protein HEK616_35020 [Streptomyces nigrescens]|uniref:Transposase n=1 Tax=Streptomyces nigrescens TaxID=1920 RepID=A0ABM7ZUI3_STRNI|nr:hypothetical protein HEK616_35020 [Streptomyces nigrescens]